MRRLRTFIHQKRFLKGEMEAAVTVKRRQAVDPDQEEEGLTTIDHRLVEDHRLKWEKRMDWVLYLAAAAFLLYAIYQWAAD